MIKVVSGRVPRVSQGDVFRDVEHVEKVTEKNGVIEVSKIVFPLVIVLSQDCDLEQDFRFRWSKQRSPDKHDKFLLSVLVAPLYNLEHVLAGDHLSELGQKMMQIPRKNTQGRNLLNNEIPRYHYLDFPATVPIVPSVIDFKHYFTVDVAYLKRLKREHCVCRLSELFREDVSLRFANYLARIGLPEHRPIGGAASVAAEVKP